MKSLTLAALAVTLIATPLAAADDAALTRLTVCKDSWYDWKDNPAQIKPLSEHLRALFKEHGNDPYLVPKTKVAVLGLNVEQAYPDSVGMGVGFSLLVSAPFDKAKKAMETALGKTLQHCEASDGMNSCELEIADKRSIALMTADNDKSRTLISCYYFYEK